MNHAVDSAAVNSHSTVLFTDPTVFSTLYLNILSQNFLYEFWQSWTNRTWRFMRSSKNRILLMLTKIFFWILIIDRKESVRQVLAQSELLLRRNRRFSRELWFWCLGSKFEPHKVQPFFSTSIQVRWSDVGKLVNHTISKERFLAVAVCVLELCVLGQHGTRPYPVKQIPTYTRLTANTWEKYLGKIQVKVGISSGKNRENMGKLYMGKRLYPYFLPEF